MKKIAKIGFFILVLSSLVMATWYVLHGDILFSTDIARDFSLLDEARQKGIVLIGPRASGVGLFHGPLWLYLNFPAFIIGNGNPIIVGWFWILLIPPFLYMSFHIAKR